MVETVKEQFQPVHHFHSAAAFFLEVFCHNGALVGDRGFAIDAIVIGTGADGHCLHPAHIIRLIR